MSAFQAHVPEQRFLDDLTHRAGLGMTEGKNNAKILKKMLDF